MISYFFVIVMMTSLKDVIIFYGEKMVKFIGRFQINEAENIKKVGWDLTINDGFYMYL